MEATGRHLEATGGNQIVLDAEPPDTHYRAMWSSMATRSVADFCVSFATLKELANEIGKGLEDSHS